MWAPKWVPQDQAVALVPLAAGCARYNSISTQLKSSLASATVVKIERVQNPELWTAFKACCRVRGGGVGEQKLG